MTTKENLPNSTAVLVLGIISVIPFIIPFNLITGIIGIFMATKGRKLNSDYPDKYYGYKNLNAGYIMSIIGTAVSGIVLLWLIIYTATHPYEMKW